MQVIVLTLPWPPSVNGYWRSIPTTGGGRRTLISKRGREFRERVRSIVEEQRLKRAIPLQPIMCRLAVEITLYPPTKRKFDLDNMLKATLDALEHARLFDNDNQIDKLTVCRGLVVNPGEAVVKVRGCEK